MCCGGVVVQSAWYSYYHYNSTAAVHVLQALIESPLSSASPHEARRPVGDRERPCPEPGSPGPWMVGGAAGVAPVIFSEGLRLASWFLTSDSRHERCPDLSCAACPECPSLSCGAESGARLSELPWVVAVFISLSGSTGFLIGVFVGARAVLFFQRRYAGEGSASGRRRGGGYLASPASR